MVTYGFNQTMFYNMFRIFETPFFAPNFTT